MGKLINVQKLKKRSEIPYKKLKQIPVKPKDKKQKKSHVLKVSNAVGGIRKRALSKKDKQKQKSLKLNQKFIKTVEAFQEEKDKKKREKRPIIGDLKPLLDSLPSLDELISIRGSSNKTGVASIDRRIPAEPKNKKDKKIQRNHSKTEVFLDRFDEIQKVWKNPRIPKRSQKTNCGTNPAEATNKP